jgi:hypothetical protein
MISSSVENILKRLHYFTVGRLRQPMVTNSLSYARQVSFIITKYTVSESSNLRPLIFITYTVRFRYKQQSWVCQDLNTDDEYRRVLLMVHTPTLLL